MASFPYNVTPVAAAASVAVVVASVTENKKGNRARTAEAHTIHTAQRTDGGSLNRTRTFARARTRNIFILRPIIRARVLTFVSIYVCMCICVSMWCLSENAPQKQAHRAAYSNVFVCVCLSAVAYRIFYGHLVRICCSRSSAPAPAKEHANTRTVRPTVDDDVVLVCRNACCDSAIHGVWWL